VERVREAVRIAQERRPDLKLEGPMQYDAAVDASVARSKMPDSEVAGHATVFVFPDLNTGNNTYKAVQRSSGAVAVGPILQGLNKPVNDLSRGCTVADIVNTVAITAIQAAETGHLVFATVHAAGCSDVVARLELLFPPDERESVRTTLAAQLHGVLCQRLLPAIAGGRALHCEFFSNEASSRRLIAEGRMNELQDFIFRGDPRSVRSFAASLLQLVRDGVVSEAVALENSDNPQEFTRALRGISSSSQSVRR
jgi:hypothetical protein